MGWDFVRTFKQRDGFSFTFTCDIREDGLSRETRDFTVLYDPDAGIQAAADALKAQVVRLIKVELVARMPAVLNPATVPISAADLA